MNRAEWLRTFLAVYRHGSVTGGAATRGLSQPAASQHLAALARSAGGPLFTRSGRGVTPTQRGRELYARVAEPLDRLEAVLAGLDDGRLGDDTAPVRIGAGAEFFEARLLPRLVGSDASFSASFGDDGRLVELLLAGEIDVAVTTSSPGRRTAVETRRAGDWGYSLVAPPALAPTRPLGTVADLAGWLHDRPWVSYSHELPATRRFWRSATGRDFDARVTLVAPDLRTVAAAVELGLGASLLPTFSCERGFAAGTLVPVHDVGELVPPETWFVSTRRADVASVSVTAVADRLVRPVR